MSSPKAKAIEVTPRQREILQDLILRRSTAQGLAQRVQIILEGSAGCSKSEQARRLAVDWRTISLWRERWRLNEPRLLTAEQEKEGTDLEGVLLMVLQDAPRSGAPGKFSAEQVAQLIALACEPPVDSQREVSHWTPHELADEMMKRKIVDSISPRQVGRFLTEAELKPHLSQYWLTSKPADPEQFQVEVERICEAYQQAPARAAQGTHTMSTDEKTGIQALERAHPTLPMKLGKIERREYEYIRHGTLTLTANFEVTTGQVVAPTLSPTRTEDEFAAHIAQTIDTDPKAGWIFIVDNLNTHQSEPLVRLIAQRCNFTDELGEKGKSGILHSMPSRAAFLQDPSHQIRFIYTPKHASWLNQVEIWFSILARRLLRRANFTSLEDLQQRIVSFIKYFNKTLAKAFKWTYTGRPLSA